MRKSLWALLIVVALVLSACGPAMPSATGAKTESGEVFQLALPRLEIAFDAQGNPTVLGMKLSDVGAMLGQDLSTLKMDPALINWMTNANIQHIEMRQTGDSLALLINGKPMPHLAWDAKALNQAMDVAALFLPGSENLFTTIKKFLPLVSRLGVDATLRFPLQKGATAIPLADPSVALTPVNPSKDPASIILKFEVKYDDQGVPSVLGLSGYDLAALGLPLPVAIDKGVLKNIQSQNIQNVAFRTQPDGMYIYLNGNRLPGLAWDKQLLKNAAEAYAQMNPTSPVIPTINMLLPMLDTLDIGIMTKFPLAPGAKEIPAQMP
jgi:hypothetical protein